MSGLAPPGTLSRIGWSVMQWMPSCLTPPNNSLKERVVGDATDRLKFGVPVMSWHVIPVTLSRNG